MANTELVNAILEDMEQERMERHEHFMGLLQDAYAKRDWEDACRLVMLNPEIMNEGLSLIYDALPDEQKFMLPVECYTHHGDSMPAVRKYVRQARKYMPVEKRVPAELLALPEITVYRAGEEELHKAKYRISWTLDLERAKWFYDRNIEFIGRDSHLYQATIRPEQIIWYTDDRNEQEVMQYGSVTNVIELPR